MIIIIIHVFIGGGVSNLLVTLKIMQLATLGEWRSVFHDICEGDQKLIQGVKHC